jgi:membrane protein DedA with SNARE-associated domain
MSPFVMAGIEQHLLNFVQQFLGTVGYPGIFVLMAIEGFGIPIPSELTMPFSGFLSSSAGGSKFSLSLAIAAGTAGEVFGGVLAYFLGYFGGRPLLERYGRFVMLGEEELARGERWFSRYGDRVVFVMRLLPAVRSFIALPAGVVRMSFWRFLLYSAVGCLIWCAALAFVGHQLGQHWQSVNKDVHRYNGVILAAVVLLVACGAYIRVARSRREVPSSSSDDDEIQPTGT